MISSPYLTHSMSCISELPPLLEGTSASEINQVLIFSDDELFALLIFFLGKNISRCIFGIACCNRRECQKSTSTVMENCYFDNHPSSCQSNIHFLFLMLLQLIVWFVGGNLQVYFIADNLNPYLIGFIKLSVHITVNSYIGVPLMFSQFGDWIHMDRPLKPVGLMAILDRGFPKRWYRLALVFCYITINLLSGFSRL